MLKHKYQFFMAYVLSGYRSDAIVTIAGMQDNKIMLKNAMKAYTPFLGLDFAYLPSIFVICFSMDFIITFSLY